MTRKSRRELERDLDELDDSSDVVDYVDLVRYLEHVAEEGRDALLPADHFDAGAEWGKWACVLRDADPVALPTGLELEELSAAERFGLRYMGPDIRRGILDLRRAADGHRQ